MSISWLKMQTKDQIREQVWDTLQKQRVARFPGAEGRIPNFIGAEACAKQLAETPYWKAARFVKVNPDSPQRAIRQRALADGKIIYMAVPRLRSGQTVHRARSQKAQMLTLRRVFDQRRGSIWQARNAR